MRDQHFGHRWDTVAALTALPPVCYTLHLLASYAQNFSQPNAPMSVPSPSHPATAQHPAATARTWLGLAVLVLPTLLLSLDLTVLHLAAPHLSAELAPTSAELLWILDIYGFMIGAFLITMGSLGDRIGRRKLLLIGASAFGVVSALAAFANSAAMLIVLRALLGIAGATLMPSTLSLIRNMFHVESERTLAITIWMTGFTVGGAIGPVVGGALLEYFHWGSVFLVGVPVMVLLLIAGPLLLPEFRDDKAGALDLPSALLCVTAMLATIYGIKHMARDGLTTEHILIMLGGLVVMAVFIRRQLMLPSPMLDLRLFSNRYFSVSVIAMLLTILALSGAWLLIYQYLQGVAGLSPLHAGLVMLPAAVLQVAASLAVPKMVERFPLRPVIGGGLILAALGLVLMTQVAGHDTHAVVILVCGASLMGVGVMPMVIMATDLVVEAAPPDKTGAAAATSETAAELGMALGIAVIGSIGGAVYRHHMLAGMPADIPSGLASAASDTIGAAMDAVAHLPAAQAQTVTALAQQSFEAALHLNSGIGAALLLLTALVTAKYLPAQRGETREH